MIFDLVRTGALSAEIAAEKLDLSVEDVRILLNETGQEVVNQA